MSLDTMTDLDDMVLDDVEDLIGWDNPQPGVHIFGIPAAGIERVKNKDGDIYDRVYIIWQLHSTIESANASDPQTLPGSVFQETFTKKGMSFFKKAVGKLLPDTDLTGVPIKAICSSLVDVYTNQANLKAAISIKVSDKGYENVNMSRMELVEIVPLPEGMKPFEYKAKNAS